MSVELIFKQECYTIVSLCIKIHKELGKGFKEAVYKDALEIEFQHAGIPYQREKKFKIEYEGKILQHNFTVDFVAYDSIILEIKAASLTHSNAFRQTLNYLKSSQIRLALLINFGTDKLLFKRIINSGNDSNLL